MNTKEVLEQFIGKYDKLVYLSECTEEKKKKYIKFQQHFEKNGINIPAEPNWNEYGQQTKKAD